MRKEKEQKLDLELVYTNINHISSCLSIPTYYFCSHHHLHHFILLSFSLNFFLIHFQDFMNSTQLMFALLLDPIYLIPYLCLYLTIKFPCVFSQPPRDQTTFIGISYNPCFTPCLEILNISIFLSFISSCFSSFALLTVQTTILHIPWYRCGHWHWFFCLPWPWSSETFT